MRNRHQIDVSVTLRSADGDRLQRKSWSVEHIGRQASDNADMSAFESDRPRSKVPAIIFVFLIIIIGLVGGAYYAGPRFEWEAPQIKLPDSDVAGLAPLE